MIEPYKLLEPSKDFDPVKKETMESYLFKVRRVMDEIEAIARKENYIPEGQLIENLNEIESGDLFGKTSSQLLKPIHRLEDSKAQLSIATSHKLPKKQQHRPRETDELGRRWKKARIEKE